MNDLEKMELDLDRLPSPGSATPGQDLEGPSRGPLFWTIPLVLLVAAFLIYFLWLREEPEPPATRVVEAAVAGPEKPAQAGPQENEEPEIVLPALDESDSAVRRLVARLSSNPRLAALLLPDELVRRFTAVVDNVAEGVSPRNHLRPLLPAEGFEVMETGVGTRISAESFTRWNGYADVFSSLDAAGSTRLVETLEPLLVESYRDLGYPDADFGTTLKTAIHHLLETPVPTGSEALEREIVTWSYADSRFEALSAAQKDLFRTGPRNVPLIQSKLREIGRALGMPEGELAGPP